MTDLITNKELLALLGVSHTTLYDMRNRGDFIEPVRLSPRRIAWRVAEVEAWLAAR